jgi:hypothetical protein
MNDGWIKLHRSIMSNEIWLSQKFTDSQAWIDLIMLANHKGAFIKKHGVRLQVPRGCVGWSEVSLSKRWKWSRGKVRRFFVFLVQQNMIEMEQQINKLSTLIKILKYDVYQEAEQQTEQQNEQQTEQQTDIKRYTNKNDKKEKNEKKKPNNGFLLPDWIPMEPWLGYVEMRSSIKKPLTDRAKVLAVASLQKLKGEGHPPEGVLNQSIFHSWQGLFPVKSGYSVRQEPADDRFDFLEGLK